MPRTLRIRLQTSLIRKSAACRALGISLRTFDRKWATVFTDSRPPEDRRDGIQRFVFEDELATAVHAGGGNRGRTEVLNYRGRIGRTD